MRTLGRNVLMTLSASSLILLVAGLGVSMHRKVVWNIPDRDRVLISAGCIEWVRWPEDWRDSYSGSFRPGTSDGAKVRVWAADELRG